MDSLKSSYGKINEHKYPRKFWERTCVCAFVCMKSIDMKGYFRSIKQ